MGVELEYMLVLGRDLWFINAAAHEALRDEVIELRKTLSGLMKSATV